MKKIKSIAALSMAFLMLAGAAGCSKENENTDGTSASSGGEVKSSASDTGSGE